MAILRRRFRSNTSRYCWKKAELCKTRIILDFPGGLGLNNLLASAGDTSSIPGPRRSHMPWSNETHVPQLLKPVRLESHKDKPPQREAWTLQPESSHCLPQLEKAHVKQWRLSAAKKQKEELFHPKYRFSGTAPKACDSDQGMCIHIINSFHQYLPGAPKYMSGDSAMQSQRTSLWESLWKGPWAQVKPCVWEQPCDLREVRSPLCGPSFLCLYNEGSDLQTLSRTRVLGVQAYSQYPPKAVVDLNLLEWEPTFRLSLP